MPRVHQYPVLTEAQWREYGAKAKLIKKLLWELKHMPVPVKMREPHLNRAQLNLFRFCSLMEFEMFRQHPDIEDPYHVFVTSDISWD